MSHYKTPPPSSIHPSQPAINWGGGYGCVQLGIVGDNCVVVEHWAADINSNALTRHNISCPHYTTNKHKTCSTIANWTPVQQTSILKTSAQLSLY